MNVSQASGVNGVQQPLYKNLALDNAGVRYAVTLGTSVLSHAVISPWIKEAISGRPSHNTNSQILMTTAVMALTSFGVIAASLPGGHLVQRPDVKNGTKLSWRTLVSNAVDFSLATISQMGVALVYHHDLATALTNGLTRGVTRGLPLSEVYKFWGDRPWRATIGRQTLNMVMMVNATTVTSLASQPDWRRALGPWINIATASEIGLVSLALYGVMRMGEITKIFGPRVRVEK
ncbi:MAG: hypothetical protein IPJ69_08440 [Deltaproteobacteria bacterium]|nr:MAG: hypothetical protein IPJ69_08440 [Deltaproteobacteria bacterium]